MLLHSLFIDLLSYLFLKFSVASQEIRNLKLLLLVRADAYLDKTTDCLYSF